MNPTTRIIKNRGLDDIIVGYKPAVPEETGELQYSQNSALEPYVRLFESTLENQNSVAFFSEEDPSVISVGSGKYVEGRKKLSREFQESVRVLPTLASADIQALVFGLLPFEDTRLFLPRAGLFLSHVLQRAYDAGMRELRLVLPVAMDYLAAEMRASPLSPLHFSLFGDCGNYLASSSTGIVLNVQGSVHCECASNAWCVEAVISGPVAGTLAHGAVRCKVHAGSVVGSRPWSPARYAYDSLFIFDHDITDAYDMAHGAKHCTFKFRQEEVLRKAWSYIPPGNKIILISPGGINEEWRWFADGDGGIRER